MWKGFQDLRTIDEHFRSPTITKLRMQTMYMKFEGMEIMRDHIRRIIVTRNDGKCLFEDFSDNKTIKYP